MYIHYPSEGGRLGQAQTFGRREPAPKYGATLEILSGEANLRAHYEGRESCVYHGRIRDLPRDWREQAEAELDLLCTTRWGST